MTQKETIAQLVANKAAAIELKKSATKNADPVSIVAGEVVNKGAAPHAGDTDTEIKRTVVGNTYNWLDSHGDVHLPGIFAKSISERTPFHLHDHLHQISARVGTPTKTYEKAIAWRDLGINKDGETVALFMDTTIEKERNAQIFNDYRRGEIQQHSVGMQYVKLDLAVNDPDYKAEKATWDQYYPTLGNPEAADKTGFFWIVREAKLKEISCVLEGSNTLTPTMAEAKSTPDVPEKSTQPQPFDVSKAISTVNIFK